jgi:hypothetical protein
MSESVKWINRQSETLIRLYLAFNPGQRREVAEEFLSQVAMDGTRWFLMEREMEKIFEERIKGMDRK